MLTVVAVLFTLLDLVPLPLPPLLLLLLLVLVLLPPLLLLSFCVAAAVVDDDEAAVHVSGICISVADELF